MQKYISKLADFTECETDCYTVTDQLTDYDVIRKIRFIQYKLNFKSIAFIRQQHTGFITVYFLNTPKSNYLDFWVNRQFENPLKHRTKQFYLDKELNS